MYNFIKIKSHFFKRWLFCFFISIFISGCISKNPSKEKTDNMDKITLVIHGGAGNFTAADLTEEEQKDYKEELKKALSKGYGILEEGGTSLDAVEATIKILEDCPMFNAGKGAVLTSDQRVELDASFMDGAALKAGAVAGVSTIKNPISAARKVMENSPHVLLVGKGAELFAKEQKLEIVDSSYFYTEKSVKQLKKIKELEKIKNEGEGSDKDESDKKFGTVGAVALDKYGNLTAGTSTGGMVNKRYGRVGDSPLIGAGTYANNKTCAVSCTGHGEYFIRNVVAYDVSALMEYKKYSLQKAAEHVIQDKLKSSGGTGGLIALDKEGNFAVSFNTSSMFRAYVNKDGSEVFIFR
jgi:L-asparaginase / beta-aspartyl-peptidase